jgi:hypothetical protein
MSGCANCVWLDWAEEVSRNPLTTHSYLLLLSCWSAFQVVAHYEAMGSSVPLSTVLAEIDAGVDDEMVKAFVKLEIKSSFKGFQRSKG